MTRDQAVGNVYVLLNPAMPGIVKIGRTRKTAEARASDLYTTGVPKGFVVLWQEFVCDCKAVEKEVHTCLSKHRVHNRREFFEVEPQDAIRALIKIAAPFGFTLHENCNRASIFKRLVERFGSALRKDICDVNIVQSEYGIFMEVLRRPYKNPKNEVTDFLDLDFIDGLISEGVDVNANAKRFVEQDEFGIVNVTNLLEENAARAIWEKHSKD
jgi:hypothetical protein